MTEQDLTNKVFTLEVEATGAMNMEFPPADFNPDHWNVWWGAPSVTVAADIPVEKIRSALGLREEPEIDEEGPYEGGGGYYEVFIYDKPKRRGPLYSLPINLPSGQSLPVAVSPPEKNIPDAVFKLRPGDVIRISMRTDDDQEVKGMYFAIKVRWQLKDGVTLGEARCGAIPLAVSEYKKHPAYAMGREAFARSEPVTKVLGVEDPLGAFAWACGWHEARFEAHKSFDDTTKLTVIKEIVNSWRWDDVKQNPLIRQHFERD